MRRSASCRDDVAVCNARVALVGAAIAMVPAFLWWLLLSAVSDPDEGANIGGGIVGVLVIATSSVAALAFFGRELVGSVTEASGVAPRGHTSPAGYRGATSAEPSPGFRPSRSRSPVGVAGSV